MVLVLNPLLIIFPFNKIRAGTLGISIVLESSDIVGKKSFAIVIRG
jgi:hypothetical protein